MKNRVCCVYKSALGGCLRKWSGVCHSASVFTDSFGLSLGYKRMPVQLLRWFLCVRVRQPSGSQKKKKHMTSKSEAETNNRHSDPKVKLRVTVADQYLQLL